MAKLDRIRVGIPVSMPDFIVLPIIGYLLVIQDLVRQVFKKFECDGRRQTGNPNSPKIKKDVS
jgi:hypothetical protein